MNTHNKTFRKENETDTSVLTATPARDIIIANQIRVECSVCGKTIGGAIPGKNPTGIVLFCRRCGGFRRVEEYKRP